MVIKCLDARVFGSLGTEQDWWCLVCNSPLEPGSEEVMFVGTDKPGTAPDRPFPVLVHGECVARGCGFAWSSTTTGRRWSPSTPRRRASGTSGCVKRSRTIRSAARKRMRCHERDGHDGERLRLR